MTNKILIAVIVLLLFAAGAFLISGQVGRQAPTVTIEEEATPPAEVKEVAEEETTITLTTSGFEPATLTVRLGTKVIWQNSSGGLATVNSAVHPIHLVFPPLNLGNFEDGESLELVFEKTGTYKYHNHLNPAQTGTVVVE